MNNIGFAATNNTAATNNNTATATANNLSALAASFTNSTSSANGGFNALIFSLFIQIIQTLLKNLQNKPCCDQQPQTPAKQLNLSEQQLDKLEKLPSLSSHEAGSAKPTIDSVIDSDKNNQLSIGDKVNLKQETDELDSNDQPIIKTSTKTLTANDLAIYNALNAPNQLSDADTERAQQAINLRGATSGTPQATGGYYDNDANGKLSLGDQVEALQFNGSGAPTPNGAYAVAKITVDEAFIKSFEKPSQLNLTAEQITNLNSGQSLEFINFDPKTDQIIDTNKDGKLSAGDTISLKSDNGTFNHILTNDETNVINGTYGQALLNHRNDAESQLQNRIGEVLDLNRLKTSNYVKTIFDKDNDGKVSAGDIALISQGRSFVPEASPPPYFPEPYIQLTEENINKINAEAIVIPDTQKASLEKLFSLTGATIIDSDGNKALSKDDILTGTATFGTNVRKKLTEDIVKQATGEYGSELPINKDISGLITQTLDLKGDILLRDLLAPITPKQIFDTDKSGNISAGDTMALVTESFYDSPYVEQIQYQQLTTEDIAKLKTSGLINN